MTLCPIAIAVGCKKCPIFAVCPVKGVIGDYVKEEPPAKSGASHRVAIASSSMLKPHRRGYCRGGSGRRQLR